MNFLIGIVGFCVGAVLMSLIDSKVLKITKKNYELELQNKDKYIQSLESGKNEFQEIQEETESKIVDIDFNKTIEFYNKSDHIKTKMDE